MRQSSDIRYKIHGQDQQFVEITLEPGQAVTAENGSMMFFEPGIQMDTRISDGSVKHSGFFSSLMGAAKRKVSGENVFLSYFENKSQKSANVAFATPCLGAIIPIDLSYSGGHVMCQRGAFMCSAKGVAISVGLAKRFGAGFFGGEGFIMQSLKGDGLVFLYAGGSTAERLLAPGQKIYIDTGSVVAFESTVDFNVQMVKGIKNMMFGAEELFLATLTGPGKIWIQSVPLPRLAMTLYQKILDVAPKKKKRR